MPRVLKKVTKRGEIVSSPGTVHTIIDGNEPHIEAGKNDFRIPTHLQIVAPETAHVFDDPGADQALLHKGKTLLDAGTVEVRSGIPVIHQNAGVREALVSGVSGQNGPLIGNRIALPIKGILVTEAAVQNRDFLLIHVVFSFLLWVS
jgi:hypothetical protein